jgi:hypothetical protein
MVLDWPRKFGNDPRPLRSRSWSGTTGLDHVAVGCTSGHYLSARPFISQMQFRSIAPGPPQASPIDFRKPVFAQPKHDGASHDRRATEMLQSKIVPLEISHLGRVAQLAEQLTLNQ